MNITEIGTVRVLEGRPRTRVRKMEFTSSWNTISEVDLETLKQALYCGNLPAIKLTSDAVTLNGNLFYDATF